jgi:chromosome condensin MukBEF MukE localization factor
MTTPTDVHARLRARWLKLVNDNNAGLWALRALEDVYALALEDAGRLAMVRSLRRGDSMGELTDLLFTLAAEVRGGDRE